MDDKMKANIEANIAAYRKERENAVAAMHALDGAITALSALLQSEEVPSDPPVPAS